MPSKIRKDDVGMEKERQSNTLHRIMDFYRLSNPHETLKILHNYNRVFDIKEEAAILR